MQIEKKLILCSVLAVAIGIAAILPVAYFMNTPHASAQTTNEQPWLNLDIGYATVGVANLLGGDSAWYTYAFNYSMNPVAIDSQIDSRIESFRIQIYTDTEQLMNETLSAKVNVADLTDQFGTNFDRDWFNLTGSINFGNYANGTLSNLSNYVSGLSNDNSTQMQAIQNAQNIYIDVHRIGYMTTIGNNTVVTSANNEIVHHLELTREDNRFVYGIRPAYYMADQSPYQTP